MITKALTGLTFLASLMPAAVLAGATAQAAESNAALRNMIFLAQATPRESQMAQAGQPGMTRPEMMAHGMSMMGGRRSWAGQGHMMKIFFALADTNGDGALSFEEVSAIHKRIFDRVDANKDGKVTLEEVEAFMRD
jgi:hypothetical protein